MKMLRTMALSLAASTAAGCGSSSGLGGLSEVAGSSVCRDTFANVAAGASVAAVDPRLPLGQPYTIILVFKDGTDMSRVESRLRAGESLSAGELDKLRVFRNLDQVFVPVNRVSLELISALRRDLDGLPLISVWGDHPQQFLMQTSAQTVGNDVQLETFGLTGAGIGVAIIDSGTDTTQGDFPNMEFNSKYDGTGYSAQSPNSDSSSGHGTHVSGTVGGHGTASGGKFKGMAPGARLVSFGTGDAILVLGLARAAAYDRVLDDAFRGRYNIRVTNNSYGPIADPATGDVPDFNPAGAIEQGTYQMYLKGVINVFAAGNDGPAEDRLSPYAACNIGVGNANREGGLNSSSSRGRSTDPFYVVDISAPGTFISSPRALSGGVTTPRPDYPEYSTISGTSMASPHVAGAVALLLQANPALGFEQIQSLLQETATPMRADVLIANVQEVGRPYAAWEAGPGMMNIAAAAARVLGGSAPPLRVGRMNLPQDGATLLGRWTALAGFIAGSAMPVPTPRLNPCLCGVFDRHYVVDVPGGASALTLRLKTDIAAEQYRLRIFGPDAAVLGDRAVFGAREYELPVPNPTPGTYRAQVSEFTTQGGNLEVSISVR